MNILIIGSEHTALRKTLDWLNQTTWLMTRIVVAEERTSKMQHVRERMKSQPHPCIVENISIVPDGETSKPSEYRLGRAVDINNFIEEHYPDGSIDYLFFCVNNDKADIMLDCIDPTYHRIGDYYFAVQKGYNG